jgi:hypothetical protein
MFIDMKELTEPIGFFHDLLWPNPDELPDPPVAVKNDFKRLAGSCYSASMIELPHQMNRGDRN